LHWKKFHSKTLNIHPKPLNGRSKALNAHSRALDGIFIEEEEKISNKQKKILCLNTSYKSFPKG
jgi:hypothetical protein